MEAESENTENVELCWRLFNEALRKVAASDSFKFNPIGWCCNMAGANLAGISKVFGDDADIKSCEFHFKDHRNKQAKNLTVRAVTSSNNCVTGSYYAQLPLVTRPPNLTWTYLLKPTTAELS